jgi:hypothetical protein
MKLAAVFLPASMLVAIAPALAEDKLAADSAFRAAKELERAGKLAEACPLYEASYRADPALGALLNLAHCHAKTGRTGTAWVEYREAVELATRKGDARVDYARKHLADLEPRLVRLRIEAPPGVTVQRDGTDVTALLAQDTVVDPGTYRVRATAPQRVAWETSIGVTREGETVKVIVPALAPVETAPVAPVVKPAPAVVVPPVAVRVTESKPAPSSRRPIAIAIGAVGLVTAGVGLGFGYHARSNWSESRASCDDANICSATGNAQIATARTSARIATWTMSAGAALVVAAGVVWLTAPSRSETRRVAVAPMLDREQVGLAAFARF